MAKTYNTIGLVSAGDPLTETIWNEQAENVNNYRVPPACRVARTTNLSLTTATITVVPWSSATYDTESPSDPMWSAGSPNRITFRTAGIYHLLGLATYAPNVTGFRVSYFQINGGARIVEITGASASGGGTTLQCSTVQAFSVSDYVEFFAFQTSGGALNLDGATANAVWATATWLGQVS